MRALLVVFLFATLTGALLGQPSRIELQSHSSTILGVQKNFNIFLPEGYDQDSLRYPVLYLFRGHEREWANPVEDGSRRGNIKTVADRLYDRGAIGRMILVMPGLGAPGTPADFDYVADELIPYIDARFRTIPVRQKRGMDGFSYGGYDMIQLLRREPELFFSAGSYDGSFWAVDLSTFFASATESYWTLLRSMKFLLHSTRQGNYASNLEFLAILDAHGIKNSFDSLEIAGGAAHNWYFADMHMERSLPLHWEHLLRGSAPIPLQLITPLPGSTVAGSVQVRWSTGPVQRPIRTIVEYSRNRGATWQEVYSSTASDTSFLWNTLPLPDGTGYMMRIRALGDTAYGFTQMGGRFTLNNPGNAIPEVGYLAPDSTQTLSGPATIHWWAEDADGDSLGISIDLSPDNGSTWYPLSEPANTGSHGWNTPGSPNSTSCRLRIRAKDASAAGEVVSPVLVVSNMRPALQPGLIQHLSGFSDGVIRVNAADSRQMTGHKYRLAFHDSIPGAKSYSVTDVDRGAAVVTFAPVSGPGIEGPLFDGLRLVLDDPDPARLSTDSTRWITGSSNLVPEVSLPTFNPGTGTVTGIRYVSDYHIRVYSNVVDTSSSLYGWDPVPMRFAVMNVTENHSVDVLFTDLNGDGRIGEYDDLILLEKDSVGGPVVTWELLFAGTGSSSLPEPGDLFLLKILKPFTVADVYEFHALPGGLVDVSSEETPFGFMLSQNYPNPFNPKTVVRGRWSVASDVTLVVYDMLGREVATLAHGRYPAGEYEFQFDGGGLASGIYFYRLTAGVSVSIKKMVLIR